MPTLCSAERPRRQGNTCGEGHISWGQCRLLWSYPEAAYPSAPQFWGFSSIYAYTP